MVLFYISSQTISLSVVTVGSTEKLLPVPLTVVHPNPLVSSARKDIKCRAVKAAWFWVFLLLLVQKYFKALQRC